MTQPVTVYRWDDVGAPQVVNGTPSEYITILKKCLVEGYGSKTPLGWTVEQEESTPPFIAFKNNVAAGGSGGVVMFSAVDNAVRTLVTGQSCLDFVDKDTAGRTGNNFALGSGSSSGNYMLTRWLIIGTATGFYYFSWMPYRETYNYNATHQSASFFCGDFNSFTPNDPARFISVGGASASFNWNYNLNYAAVSASGVSCRIYAADGDPSSSNFVLSSMFGNAMGSGSADVRANIPAEITVLSEVILVKNKGVVNQNSAGSIARGVLPGMYCASEAGYRDVGYQPHIKSIKAQQHYQLPDSNQGASACWINMEQWQ